jgi:glycosyltransferase involved in cell wall biosynthesis
MRVAHVYKGYPPILGGIEGHLDLLTRLLVENGIEAEVYCARPRGALRRETRDGVKVMRCAAPLTVASTPLTPSLPLALRRSSADLLHLHYPWPAGEAAWLLGSGRRPLVVTVHCEAVRYPRLARFLAPLTQRVLSRAQRILVTGPFMLETPLLADFRERARVVPLGVDLDHFRPDPNVSDPLPGIAHPRVVFVGRLRHYKGLSELAAALARLRQAQLIIAGDGPERGAFEGYLEDAGCADRTHFLGDVDDAQLLRILQTTDAAVLASTSHAEGFGLSIAEAQACGVPAVTTDVGTGTAQTVEDGVSGRVVRPADPIALAEALAWCLEPADAPQRRAAARAHAEANLDARRMTNSIMKIYSEVLEGSQK